MGLAERQKGAGAPTGMGRARLPGALALALPLALSAGCGRETRDLRTDPAVVAALGAVALMPNGIGGAPPDVYVALGQPFERNAYDLAQGKRLYAGFGCRGCHGDGQGGKGPAFLDGWWQYGPDIVSIFASIRDGRPGGMPAFRAKLTTDQIWQLAGYVQTIGAYSASAAAPGRNDEKQTRPAENRAPATLFQIQPQGR